jgi:hypothetical protein
MFIGKASRVSKYQGTHLENMFHSTRMHISNLVMRYKFHWSLDFLTLGAGPRLGGGDMYSTVVGKPLSSCLWRNQRIAIMLREWGGERWMETAYDSVQWQILVLTVQNWLLNYLWHRLAEYILPGRSWPMIWRLIVPPLSRSKNKQIFSKEAASKTVPN